MPAAVQPDAAPTEAVAPPAGAIEAGETVEVIETGSAAAPVDTAVATVAVPELAWAPRSPVALSWIDDDAVPTRLTPADLTGSTNPYLTVSPGLSGLMAGGWLFAGVLGALIIRKPGAAIYTEVVAAVVSMAIGTQWGFETLIWGVVQGAAAELGFALFFYLNWRLTGALVAGAIAGLSTGLLDTTFSSIAAQSIEVRLVYIGSAIVSGIVIAGLVSWFIMRALAATGALDRFASGREARVAVAHATDDPDAA